MQSTTTSRFVRLSAVAGALIGAGSLAEAADATESAARLEALQRLVNEQSARLEALKRTMAQEEARLNDVKRALSLEVVASQRARGVTPDAAAQAQAPDAVAQAAPVEAVPQGPVGQAPPESQGPPPIPQIFDQPGVLTPKGHGVVEPSLEYSYSSANRIALIGYTVIPAILIGVIDVRETKRNTVRATLTTRYGVTNRFELEGRLPYIYRSDTSIGREILQGSATNTAFEASGSGIGDVEATARYQLNDGGADMPYIVGSLRVKSRTGTDPFEVTTSNTIAGLRGGVQTSLPTGSGFWGVQPAITGLFPSDPVVFFGTLSYLYSFKRDNVTAQTDAGPQDLGTVQPGGVIGFNFGMGLGLNEKSSFSLGYDHASVGRTKQNGINAADSVRLQLGTLLVGYAYRLGPTRTLSVSLGVGVTRDTPDVNMTVRLPITF